RRRAWPGATAPSSTASWNAIRLNRECSSWPECPAPHPGDENGAGQRQSAKKVKGLDDAVAVGEESHDKRRGKMRNAPAHAAEGKRGPALLGPARLRDGDLEVERHGARAEADH